jgi:hypothetical protein
VIALLETVLTALLPLIYFAGAVLIAIGCRMSFATASESLAKRRHRCQAPNTRPARARHASCRPGGTCRT